MTRPPALPWDNADPGTQIERRRPRDPAAVADPDEEQITDTALLEELRDLAEDGTLSLRVADIMPARYAAKAHRRLAADGIRGRIVLDFETPLIP